MSKKLTIILVVTFYFFLTAVFTWPLFFNFRSLLYGIPGDAQGGLWFVWWTKEAISSGKNILQTSLLSAPYASYLPSGLDLFNSLLVLPVTWLLGVFAGYNFLVFLSFILAGLGMFLLVRYLTKNNLAALLAGAIFAFSPYHLVRAYQHWDLAQIQWLPFLLLFLLRFQDRRKITDLFLAFIFFLLNFTSLVYGLFAIIIVLSWLLFLAREKKFLLILVFTLAILMTSHFFIFSKRFANFNRPINDFYYYSLKARDYLLPATTNFWFGKYTQPIVTKDLSSQGNTTEKTAYLGILPIMLALFALGKSPVRKKYLFLFLALLAFGASLPPFINFFKLQIPTLSYLIYKIAPFARSVGRFSLLVQFSVAILAGIGIAHLGNLFKNSSKFLFVILVFAFLILILGVEYYSPSPKNLTRYFSPPVYTWLSQQPKETIVIEYPLKNTAGFGWSEQPYYQTYHQRPIFNSLWGLEKTTIPESEKKLWSDLDDFQAIILPQNLDKLKKLGVKYILVHPNAPFSTLQFNKDFLEQINSSSLLKKIAEFGPKEEVPFRFRWDEFEDTIVYEII